MKKVLSLAAFAAMFVFATSCGNDEAEKKRKEDSAHSADSANTAMMAQKHMQDSAHAADSMKTAMDNAHMMHIQDSTKMADSMAKGKKKK